MKSTIQMISCLLLVSAVLMLTGCEYDVAEPQWTQPQPETPVPEITGMDPADVAGAGANTITITGVHFGASKEMNDVYFDNVQAEVITNFASSNLGYDFHTLTHSDALSASLGI